MTLWACGLKLTMDKPTRIKQDYPIDLFASSYLTQAGRRGQTQLYVCPAHADTIESPNLEVYLPGHHRYGYCKCWRCGFSGTVIDLAMEVFGISTPAEAMRRLENEDTLPEAKERPTLPKRTLPAINQPQHIGEMVSWSRKKLLQDDYTVAYLARRGLGGAIVPYGLGSTLRMPEELLPEVWDEENGTRGMRSFRAARTPRGTSIPRLLIPYWRPDGTVKYCNARAAGSVDGKQKYRKPSGIVPEPYLFDWCLVHHNDILITEGELDALSLRLTLKDEDVGVCAIPGLHCFGETDAAKLVGRRVFIVTDNDEAGNEGRDRLSEMIVGYASQLYHLRIESGYNDLNDMLIARGRAFVHGWFKACLDGALREAPKRFL